MSTKLKYEDVNCHDGFMSACHRLLNNDTSLDALRFVQWRWMFVIARLSGVEIKDAAAFVEGMEHNTHLKGLEYVHESLS